MFDTGHPTWTAVLLAGIQLLKSATQDLKLCRWLAPFRLDWVIASLLFLLPFILKGSWFAIAIGYLLVGALIVNTLFLSVLSLMPHHIVSLKSSLLERVSLVMMGLLCTGIVVLCKNGWACLKGLVSRPIQFQGA